MKSFLLICSLLFVAIACNQMEECQEVKLSVSHLECENSRSSPHVDLNNNYIVIRSRETYDAQVTGDCHPEVDFNRYDLLIGRQSSGNEVDTIFYDLRRICPEDELILTIDIVQSLLTRPDNVVYHALIPKLGDEETLRVLINLQ